MLRVTPVAQAEAEAEVGCCLHVEGRLAGPSSLAVLRQALEEAGARGRRVVLELSGLRFADDDAVQLLADTAARGVELAGCSPWLASQLAGAR